MEKDRIDSLLEERGGTHGDYEHYSYAWMKMVNIIDEYKDNLTNACRSSLYMITSKIARILTGNPFHKDHWDDIQGYAKLADNDNERSP